MNPHSHSAQQWLDYATTNLEGLYKLFKDDGWQEDCSLLHGLGIALGQIKEAKAQLPSGPDRSSVLEEAAVVLMGIPAEEVFDLRRGDTTFDAFKRTGASWIRALKNTAPQSGTQSISDGQVGTPSDPSLPTAAAVSEAGKDSGR